MTNFKTTRPISTKLNWHTASLGRGDSKKGHTPFQGEINVTKEKTTKTQKIVTRTTWPISTILGTKHSWVMGIIFFSYDKGSLIKKK